jgi:transcriptional regulator with XRE-family HTH domain
VIHVKNYGELIKKARTERGVKANWVAARLGVSESTYNALENGRRKLTVERTEEIAHILGITLADIFCQNVSGTLNKPTGTEGR